MRRRFSLTRGAVLGAALVLTWPSVLAAAAKHKKPKHTAPAAADSAPHDGDSSSKPAPKPSDDAPAKPSDDAPAKASVDAPAKPSDSAAAKSIADAKPAPAPDSTRSAKTPATSAAAPKLDHDAVASNDDEALGRREAARIAAGRTEVAVLLSAEVGNRRFQYSDPIGRLLAPYSLPIAPMAAFGLEAYPFASSGVPGLRDVGFRGRVSRAFGVDSNTPDGSKIATSWTRFGGELRERLLFSGSHPFELGIDLGADASYFVMSTTSRVAALLPSARTIAIDLGVDARLLLGGRISLLFGGAYLAVTSPGEIYDRFRKPSVGGIDADLGFAVALVPGLEGRLTARYTRYFATFTPRVGDPAVAGGALDEQLELGLGVRYAH